MILAGDIGATKSELGLFERADRPPLRHRVLANRGFASLEAVLTDFLSGAGGLRAACLGVAGPVDDGAAHMTNLDWSFNERDLSRALCAPVCLANDLVITARAVAALPDGAFVTLNPSARQWGRGHMAVVAPGTGLGEAGLYFDGAELHPLPSEGGHCDFAAVTSEEQALATFLRARYGSHVSWERVLSGPGIGDLYAFILAHRGAPMPPALAALPEIERPAAVTALAQSGDRHAAAALSLFASILGREAGNAALRYLATGGVALAGGIPPRILPYLQQPGFMAAFAAKGRFAPLLQSLPVRVVVAPAAAMLGAAMIAERLAGAVMPDPAPGR